MQEALGSVPVPNKIRCNSLCVNPSKMEKIQDRDMKVILSLAT